MGFGDFSYDRRHPKVIAEGTLRKFEQPKTSCLPEPRASMESSKYHRSPIRFEFHGLADTFFGDQVDTAGMNSECWS